MEAALRLSLTRRSPRLSCNWACLKIRRRRYAYRSVATLGAYSHESLRKLSDEERLWLYNNAFRPDRKKNTGRSVLSSTLGQGSFHGYAIRCLSSCNVFSIDVFSCFLMVCNLTFPSTKTHQKQSERAKFPKLFWGGGGACPQTPLERSVPHLETPPFKSCLCP